MPNHRALEVVRQVLEEVDPDRLPLLDQPPTIVVNGVGVPVVRLRWQAIGDFFSRLFEVANGRLFGGTLPGCQIAWNPRFRNLGGRIDPQRRRLELSSAHFEACGAVALGIVLVHEQIHLALFEEQLPFGHTREFARRSAALGLPNIHHQMPLPERLRRPTPEHLYRCDRGHLVRSRVRFRTPRACAPCCDQHAQGRFDERFPLHYVRTIVPATS